MLEFKKGAYGLLRFLTRCCCWGHEDEYEWGYELIPDNEPKVEPAAVEETTPKAGDWKAKVGHAFVVQKRFSQMKEEMPDLDWDRLFIIWAKVTLTED
ncbi:hypothetical protein JTE90_004274 [Oedothorax gibbosus]|uniref:Uncharacterized protein n=1 Tax=Oedothorax gibbosus TaxID=931172 RepID=A0AAV6U0W3_9ARAC|nr:hypothetical protein JTE90_004274 [Oedothorax gibbosus]